MVLFRFQGNRTNVILGGGRLAFKANSDKVKDSRDKWTCQRKDGRDLIQDWKTEKDELSPGRNVVVFDRDGLKNVDPSNTDYLFGVFAPTHMSYADLTSSNNEPSLTEMAVKAVDILKLGQVSWKRL